MIRAGRHIGFTVGYKIGNRLSATDSSDIPNGAILTEDGKMILTEDGKILIIE